MPSFPPRRPPPPPLPPRRPLSDPFGRDSSPPDPLAEAAKGGGSGRSEARSGQTFSTLADRRRSPGCRLRIIKLFTALAALDTRLGPSHRFETVIRGRSRPGIARERPAVVGRTRAFVGGGDPALNSEDWWRLAADLRATQWLRSGWRGIVVVDPSCISIPSTGTRTWGQPSSRAYHAPVAGLSANYGAFFVRVAPGLASPGDPVRVAAGPPLWLTSRVQNRGRTLTGPAWFKADSLVDRPRQRRTRLSETDRRERGPGPGSSRAQTFAREACAIRCSMPARSVRDATRAARGDRSGGPSSAG